MKQLIQLNTIKEFLKLFLLTIILCICYVPRVSGTDWYVNPNATGFNNGTNWENGWTKFSFIVWGQKGIRAGDKLYLSGGKSSQSYTEKLVTSGSGTQENPIYILVGQDDGHNGHVIINNQINITGQWTTLNGGKNPDLTWQGVFGTNEIMSFLSSNINLTVCNSNGHGVFMQGTNGNVCKWINAKNCGESYFNGNTKIHGICHYYNAISGSFVINSEISYCLSRSNIYDGINFTANNGSSWNGMVISYCVVHDNGDDNLQLSDCATVHHCWIEGRRSDSAVGHPDAVQAVGDYFWFHHNFVEGEKNSWVYFEFGYSSVGDSDIGHWRIHDNFFFCRGKWLNSGYGVYFGTQMNGANVKEDFIIPDYGKTNALKCSSDQFKRAIGSTIAIIAEPSYGPLMNYGIFQLISIPNNTCVILKNLETENGDYALNNEPGTIISAGNWTNSFGYYAATHAGVILYNLDIPDVIIANNTFYNGYQQGIALYTKTSHSLECGVTNWLVVNNIFHNSCTPPNSFAVSFNASAMPLNYPVENLIFDYNVLSGTSTNLRYGRTNYTSLSFFNSWSGYTNNTSSIPTFVNTNDYNLMLALEDRVAREMGTNLSGLKIGEMLTDLTGTPKQKTWSIGAFQNTSSPIISPPKNLRLDKY